MGSVSCHDLSWGRTQLTKMRVVEQALTEIDLATSEDKLTTPCHVCLQSRAKKLVTADLPWGGGGFRSTSAGHAVPPHRVQLNGGARANEEEW